MARMEPRIAASREHGDPSATRSARRPARVAGIVEAAERAAAELREQAEARARERIAEADRAAANRVRAAEEEAEEMLREARAQAEAARNEAVVGRRRDPRRGRARARERRRPSARAAASAMPSRARERRAEQLERASAASRASSCARATASSRADAQRGRDQAEQELAAAHAEAERIVGRGARAGRAGCSPRVARRPSARVASGGEDLEKLRAEAARAGPGVRAKAREDAREIVSESHVVAREVLREGTELSRNLRELSVSLRNNAERLLRDVRLAHGSMTARLDQAGPAARRAGWTPARAGARRRRPGDDLDVPEFIPPE